MCNQSPKCQNGTSDVGQCSLYTTALPFGHNAVLRNQAYASVWRGQLDWGDISMPLVWFGDWSWSSYALASPHCTERNFMWQRVEWNVRSLCNKHRLALWLWLFRKRGQGKCTSLQVSGTEARTACFWDANAIWFTPGQICPQVEDKIRVGVKWKRHDSASNPPTVRMNMHSWCVSPLLPDRQRDNQVWHWDCCTWTLHRDRCCN